MTNDIPTYKCWSYDTRTGELELGRTYYERGRLLTKKAAAKKCLEEVEITYQQVKEIRKKLKAVLSNGRK